MRNGLAIVIAGTRTDWPGGPRKLTPLGPNRERIQTFWFGATLAPGDNEVWFRITSDAIRRMRETTAGLRGARLVELLIAWLGESPDQQLRYFNEFQVFVSDDGDTRIEHMR